MIFVTELVAFFTREGWFHQRTDPDPREHEWTERTTPLFAFSREAYGAVRVRTDGTRLLVFTDSGLPDKKEAYAYTLGADAAAPPEEIVRV